MTLSYSEMVKRLEVEALVTQFFYNIDRGFYDRIGLLFSAEGELVAPHFSVKGRPEIDKLLLARSGKGVRKTKHIWNNAVHEDCNKGHLIEVATITFIEENGVTSVVAGDAVAHMNLENGSWLFGTLTLRSHINGKLV